MKPPDYFFDTAAEGPGHYPQRFCVFFMAVVKALFTLCFRVKAYGAEFLKDPTQAGQHPYIIAGNHRSYLDPLFVMMALRPRPLRFMAKEEFLNAPIAGRVGAWVGAFPVKRDSADIKVIKRAATMLKRGELVGIFPEGTRGRGLADDAKRDAHEGVALLAHLAKANVVPVRIWNAAKIAPAGARRWHFPRITLRFGEPLSLTEERYSKLDKETRFATFTADIMAAVYALENPREKG